MDNTSKRLKKSQRPLIEQNSPFLNLPPELRNIIYEFVAQKTEEISFRGETLLYSPKESFVCRQIRNEYKEIYLEEAPKHAMKVNSHITDFIPIGPAIGSHANDNQYIPNSIDKFGRVWTIEVFLTIFWDHQRLNLRRFIDFGASGMFDTEHKVVIRWDRDTFDAEFLRQNLQKLKFCHEKTKHPGSQWLKVEKAFVKAFEWHDAHKKKKRMGRKRKRPSGGNQTKATKRRK